MKPRLTGADLLAARRMPGVDSVLLNAIQKSINGQPFVYVNQRQGIDTRQGIGYVSGGPSMGSGTDVNGNEYAWIMEDTDTPGWEPSPGQTTPTPGTGTPGGGQPVNPANPQVLVYGEDVWKNNPTNDFFNGKGNPYMMDQLADNAWRDPATGAYLQSERNTNANTYLQLDDDPVRQGFIRSQMQRGNRDYDTERARVIRNAPIGGANDYTRTG